MIKSLSTTPIEKIFKAFKEAFIDYEIPMAQNFLEDQRRWTTAQVDYSLSYGYFSDEKLLAFVLHSRSRETLYNFLTGVTPKARGQRLISKIYESIESELEDFKQIQLLVLEQNENAIKMYERMGFKKTRTLSSFEGESKKIDKKLTYRILPLKKLRRFLSLHFIYRHLKAQEKFFLKIPLCMNCMS